MLLKAYFATSAAWYISQGNGSMAIEDASSNDRLTAPPDAKRKPRSAPGGPWGRIIANAITHSEEHVLRRRAPMQYSLRVGAAVPRATFPAGDEDGLEGREWLDGTIVVRTASLTLDRLGWAHESGKELADWDREGYMNGGI